MTEGFCFRIHGCNYVAWLVMLEYIMEVSEKAEEGRNVFAALVCEGAADEGKVAAEN